MRVAVGSDDAGFDLNEVTGATVVADAFAAARAGHRSLEGNP
jgi:hypothetical protein